MSAPEEPNVDALAQRLQEALGEGYLVEKPLGAGGFAVVYLVRDLSLKRSLAVKVLSPDLITSKTVLERFRREAETVAQLSHPNIVPLHFIGQKDDLLYLAMACIDGGSVADRVEKHGPLPVADATRIIMEVASALAHAHKRGVIHRDIKPQNVLTDAESGRSLVTDFGIARTSDSSLTSTGMFVGTPTYLSPEQVTGEPSDHRADIYALGVMAYEILSGKPPFDGPTPTAILMKRLAGPPEPITTVRNDVPEELANVIEACLASDPEQRFQSAADIVAALGGDPTRTPTIPGGKTVKRPQAAARGVSKGVLIGAVVGAIAVVGGLAMFAKNQNSPPLVDDGSRPADSSMVRIAGGVYEIGSNLDSTTAPAHPDTIAEFRIDQTEVTVAAYKEFVDSGKASAPWPRGGMPAGNMPVTGVTWDGAQSYCSWRHGPGGRLPDEQEWEAAARGKEGRNYTWSGGFDPANANTAAGKQGKILPVGTYPTGATPEKVKDLIGNVWEWTASEYHPYPGAKMRDTRTTDRVIRGGAWNAVERNATGWYRGHVPPSQGVDELSNTGFRCAKSAPPTARK